MSRIRPLVGRAAVYALVALGLFAILGLVAVDDLPRTTPPPDVWGFRWMQVILVVVYVLAGAAIALRQPGNAVGWTLLLLSVGAVSLLAGTYADYALVERGGTLPGGAWAAWFASWSLLCCLGPISTCLFLLFPDGRLPSPRWRPVAWYTAVGLVAVPVLTAVLPGTLGQAPSIDNPLWPGVHGTPFDQDRLRPVLQAAIAPATILCAAALIQRFRRAEGIERQQLKLMAYAGVMVALGVALLVPLGRDNKLLQVIQMATVLLVPIAAGIAIFRYRLYDIDLLIRRTLVYGLTTGSLAGAFFAGIVVLQQLLRPFTAGSEFAVAGSTLASLALFQPLRSRIQAGVDRRFYRARYDAALELEAFTSRLANEVDLDAVGAELAAAVAETMRPAHVSLWLREAR